MTAIEIQDYIHVYSMFSFRNATKEPGIIINKYNVTKGKIEYFFVSHYDMAAYKTAFEKYDRETCNQLSRNVSVDEILNIRPVSLQDYKMLMELVDERKKLMSMK